LEVRTSNVDQHSSLATVIPNAAWRLIAALRSLRSENGKILIAGFLDGVPPPDPEMLRYLRKNTSDPLSYKDEFGAREIFGGKTRYARLKRAAYGTTCTIDGIWSGYMGPGHKTVNPAVAHAKLDFRLLPGQRPDAIFDRLVAHLRTKGFSDVKVDKDSVFEPASCAISERLPQAILAATREVYGTEPNVFPWSYGSSPTWYFTRMGTPAPHGPGGGYQGSRAHAPHEQIRLQDAGRPIQATAVTLMLPRVPRGVPRRGFREAHRTRGGCAHECPPRERPLRAQHPSSLLPGPPGRGIRETVSAPRADGQARRESAQRAGRPRNGVVRPRRSGGRR